MRTLDDSRHNSGPIDFLIVTALPEELEAVLRLLEDYEQVQIGGSLICYVCTLPADVQNSGYKVAVTKLSQMGNVEAGIHTTQVVNELNPSYVLMVGIAAGVKSRVNLGDIIIPTQVIYYEQAKQTPDGVQCRPLSIPSDHCLLHNAQNYRGVDWQDLIAIENPLREHTGPSGSDTPRVHFGPFAVGDKVIADQHSVNTLLHLHPKLIGMEMESYGVALAAAIAPARPRFLAIRSVSDFADEDKGDDWREQASLNAAAFTIGFLRSGAIAPNESLPKSITVSSKQAGELIAIRHLSMQHIPSQTIIDSLPERFAGSSVTELLVEQTDLYNNGRLIDPRKAAERQANLDQHVNDLLESYPNASVAYFGIAHIPLLFHLGYRLTNKCKLHFFELNRYVGRWEYLQGETVGPELKLDGLPPYVNEGKGDVIVRISISNTIRPEEIAGIVPLPIASLHLRIEPTQRDVMVSDHQLHRYGSRFRWMLDNVHELLPNRERVHVFYAGPVSLAVYFGQLISQTIDRKIVVYNYTSKDSPRYSWGLEITGETNSSDFLVEAKEFDQEGI